MLLFGLILPMLYAVCCCVAWFASRRAGLVHGERAALAILVANLSVFVPGVPLISRAFLAPATIALSVMASRAAQEAAFQERSNRDREERLETAISAFTAAAIIECLVLLIGGVSLWAAAGPPL